MCGIVGYVGTRLSRSLVLDGLKKLEYRGYDSAGYACIQQNTGIVSSLKRTGSIKYLIEDINKTSIDGIIGIGHIRWSTHGVASELNAHPLVSCDKKIALVHNGIFEDYEKLKCSLQALGHTFTSQTDTEIAVHLLEECLKKKACLKSAALQLVAVLNGSYALVALFQKFPNALLAIRKKAPLCIGLHNKEFYVASDPLAFEQSVQKVIFLPEDSIAVLNKDDICIINFQDEEYDINQLISSFTHTATDQSKKGFEHFMLKEIFEQRTCLERTVDYYAQHFDKVLTHLGVVDTAIVDCNFVQIVACGTSYHAGLQAELFFSTIAHLSVKVSLASELRYAPFIPNKNALYIFITQSGETADVLEALRLVTSHNLTTLAVVNVQYSSITRQANGFLLTHAGTEVSVASTKAFSSQIASLYWFAYYCAYKRGIKNRSEFNDAQRHLLEAAQHLENNLLNTMAYIKDHIAPLYAHYEHIIFLGRHQSYCLALEAALKLKEIAYIIAEAYAAGELKHGHIALLQKGKIVVIFSSAYPLIYHKIVANAQEVKARNAHLLIFAFKGDQELIDLADNVIVIERPPNPQLEILSYIGLVQFFVYQIARLLGRSIDKPRNLAKSVTVE